MASGYDDFVGGEFPTASKMNDYLMRQVIMVFASTAARDSALTTDKRAGMYTFQTDTARMTYYTGSAWRTVYQPTTSFTPTWNNVTLGNAGQTNIYYRQGDEVTAIYNFTFGSTTAFTGAVSATLPVPAATSIGFVHGSSLLNDVSARRYGASCQLDTSGGQSVSPTHSISVSGLVGGSEPFTWATGDNLLMTISYPAA